MSPTSTTGGQVVYNVGAWRLGDDGAIYRHGKLRYSNGDEYDGEWVDGQRSGRGSLTFSRGGGRYVGEFRSNLFHGFGVLQIAKSQHPLTKRWRAGESYEGEFANGVKHGRGVARLSSGDGYDGEFVRGKFHGKGTCTYASGDVYDGEWAEGEWQGLGELRLNSRNGGGLSVPSGSSYIGEFSRGRFDGDGRFLFGSGGRLGSYVGGYKRGKRHGHGTRVFVTARSEDEREERRYEGEWVDDEPHGVGVLECASFKLVGQFEMGKPHGRGVQSLANGDTYEGEFRAGDYHGSGHMTYRDGGEYKGEFAMSKRHGHGRRVFANGDVYDGEWVDDRMHGRGILTRVAVAKVALAPGKRRQSGNNKDAAVGTTVYDGDFERGQQTGQARITFSVVFGGRGVVGDEWMDEVEFPDGSECWHSGRGSVKYVGGILRGYFHGQGVLVSPDNKQWRGQWINGELHGHGERVYLPLELDAIRDAANAPQEQHQLGMYRMVKYEGEFDHNERHGIGSVVFENGDRLRGDFRRGFCCGVARYSFFRSNCTKDRYAEYDRGRRVRWLSAEEEAAVRSKDEAPEDDRQTQQLIVRALMA